MYSELPQIGDIIFKDGQFLSLTELDFQIILQLYTVILNKKVTPPNLSTVLQDAFSIKRFCHFTSKRIPPEKKEKSDETYGKLIEKKEIHDFLYETADNFPEFEEAIESVKHILTLRFRLYINQITIPDNKTAKEYVMTQIGLFAFSYFKSFVKGDLVKFILETEKAATIEDAELENLTNLIKGKNPFSDFSVIPQVTIDTINKWKTYYNTAKGKKYNDSVIPKTMISQVNFFMNVMTEIYFYLIFKKLSNYPFVLIPNDVDNPKHYIKEFVRIKSKVEPLFDESTTKYNIIQDPILYPIAISSQKLQSLMIFTERSFERDIKQSLVDNFIGNKLILVLEIEEMLPKIDDYGGKHRKLLSYLFDHKEPFYFRFMLIKFYEIIYTQKMGIEDSPFGAKIKKKIQNLMNWFELDTKQMGN
ncbi:hypothetical protein GPJ56_010435 [Histomonas meleagridis]|uniref:uncharacterized protein n=1 Tax=Histomonas meleagridis TaxID=135588 RepID=UPI003559F83F|nr:hypothetical protein GPJ56_010435 [Histomonas meleagridis]KAH0799006.1 hypothetical protein GO595_008158 [Histomonas meleagridis]